MRIAICAGAASPARADLPREAWQGAALAYRLADLCAASDWECHLLGPGGSLLPPRAHLHYIPGSYGLLSADCDGKAHEWYGELLRTCDVVHDLSPSLAVAEALFLDDPAFPYLYTADPNDPLRPRFGRRNPTGPYRAGAGADGAAWLSLYRRVAQREFWQEALALP